jgi:7,8-dihydropterin-6-yl-methyl-4-(beta-D-ribofuranosyl)aminobenzene 5'-phosphate synthase
MKITIIYDNTTRDRRLGADWGFACLVEASGRKILFDTGANGNILINNMKYLGIRPAEITDIFISHDHWDHTGGLPAMAALTRSPCFVPGPLLPPEDIPVVRIGGSPRQLHDGIWSTGTLAGIEQSLIVQQENQVVVVTGCSHPGVKAILAAAGNVGTVTALIGGLHEFDQFEVLDGLSLVCPTHCTRHMEDIRRRFPAVYVDGGAASVLNIG